MGGLSVTYNQVARAKIYIIKLERAVDDVCMRQGSKNQKFKYHIKLALQNIVDFSGYMWQY